MLRPLAWCLGLGAASVVLTATTGGGAAPFVSALAGGLAGGAAGNFGHEVCKALDRRVVNKLLDGRPGIAENHVVTQALRLAQLKALAAIQEKFDITAHVIQGFPRATEAQRFSNELANFIGREIKSAEALTMFQEGELTPRETELRKAVLGALPDAFDQSLAERRLAGDQVAEKESFHQIRQLIEAAVVEELRLTLLAPGEEPPAQFSALFAGIAGKEGWFDLFVREAADQIKRASTENGGFEKIWNAEQVALVKAFTEAHSSILDEINARSKRIEQVQGRHGDILQDVLSATRVDNLAKRISCGEYFVAVRNVLAAYGKFVSLARWQFSAKSLRNNGRHWYVNAAALIYLCSPKKWEPLNTIMSACHVHDGALASFLAVSDAEQRSQTAVIRHEVAKLRHVVQAFIEILERGNTANPDDIGFNAAAMQDAMLAIVSSSGFETEDVDELRQLLAYRQFISQRECCPMPLDNIYNTAFEAVTPRSMTLPRRNEIFYSFLDTAYCDEPEIATNRKKIVVKDGALAKRTKCITYCRLFLNWPSVSKEMDTYANAPDGHLQAKRYVVDYGRRYVKEAAEFLLSEKMITENIKEHWYEIAESSDFEIEPMFDVDVEIEKARRGNLDTLAFRWISPEGLFRAHPVGFREDATDYSDPDEED